jgi:hypothetical protein
VSVFEPRKLFHLGVKGDEVTCTVDFDEGYTYGAWEDFPADSPLTIRALQLARERGLTPTTGRIHFGEDAELLRVFNELKATEKTTAREAEEAPYRVDNETLAGAIEASAGPRGVRHARPCPERGGQPAEDPEGVSGMSEQTVYILWVSNLDATSQLWADGGILDIVSGTRQQANRLAGFRESQLRARMDNEFASMNAALSGHPLPLDINVYVTEYSVQSATEILRAMGAEE